MGDGGGGEVFREEVWERGAKRGAGAWGKGRHEL